MKELGKISFSRLQRNGLPSQIIPYLNGNFKVKSINTKNREVYVKKSRQPLAYFKNKVDSFHDITEIIARHPINKIALVQIQQENYIDKVDRRTELDSPSDQYNLIRHRTALFIQKSLTTETSQHLESIYQSLNLDPSWLTQIKIINEQLGAGTALMDTTGLGLVQMIYNRWNFNASSEKAQPNGSDNVRSPVNKGHISSSRLKSNLKFYEHSWMVIPDIHFDGKPVFVHGQEMDIRDYCRMMVAPLTHASCIVLLGDILDKPTTKAMAQLHILYETLDQSNLIEKTYLIRGNHDPHPRYFLWRKKLLVYPHLRISLTPYQDLIFCHGDNMGVEPFMEQPEITDTDIEIWRENLSYRVNGKRIRKTDILILGHAHNIYGYCNKKTHTLLVPSFKKYWQVPRHKNTGWLGLFYYASLDDPWDWNIAIEAP